MLYHFDHVKFIRPESEWRQEEPKEVTPAPASVGGRVFMYLRPRQCKFFWNGAKHLVLGTWVCLGVSGGQEMELCHAVVKEGECFHCTLVC